MCVASHLTEQMHGVTIQGMDYRCARWTERPKLIRTNTKSSVSFPADMIIVIGGLADGGGSVGPHLWMSRDDLSLR